MTQLETLSDIERAWQTALRDLYPPREISNLFRFAVEDLFGYTWTEQKQQKETIQPQTLIDHLEEVLARLQTGEPLQYITGFTYFDELKIGVSPAVLIPRPETEELVHWILESVPADFNGTITDWCTGSGCIALALKYHLPQATLFGYDISRDALAIARKNAEALELTVTFDEEDALFPVSARETGLIVSNPPYIPQKELSEMQKNVKAFEPHIALFVPDGEALLFYEAITRQAIRQLSNGGLLFFELHEKFTQETKAMIAATGAFHSIAIRNDLQDKPRMLRAVRG